MNCKISCSFGEIIDKVTILNIKRQKIKNKDALLNIQTELDLIEKENEKIKIRDELFEKLYDTNLKLWYLEDKIREKSSKKEYDEKYIEYAELIHITNDLRYEIKRQINNKYNSLIKEEKNYDTSKGEENNYNDNDYKKLNEGKILYTKGEYEKSMKILSSLIKKYKKCNKNDQFYIELLFSYNNICSVLNINFPYESIISNIMQNIEIMAISKELKIFCRQHYARFCLLQKKYSESYNYLNEINTSQRTKLLNGKTVNKYNMDFFKQGDRGKTLLLYNGQGIGDGFMYFRFIPIIFKKFPDNKIILIESKRNCWIYEKTFEQNHSIIVKNYNDENIPQFDYHCSAICLIKYLAYEYDTIPFDPLFEKTKLEPSLICRQIIWKITSKKQGKKTYIFNWKGAKNNHELKNRRMELINADKLFQIKNTNWIIVTKDVTNEEMKILNMYKNVEYYGNILDLQHTYIDTASIMRHVDGVISTDTSILHLSANLNIPSYALLTLGCDWRWCRNEKTTNWYPSVKLFRQKQLGDWSDVIKDLIDELKSNKV